MKCQMCCSGLSVHHRAPSARAGHRRDVRDGQRDRSVRREPIPYLTQEHQRVGHVLQGVPEADDVGRVERRVGELTTQDVQAEFVPGDPHPRPGQLDATDPYPASRAAARNRPYPLPISSRFRPAADGAERAAPAAHGSRSAAAPWPATSGCGPRRRRPRSRPARRRAAARTAPSAGVRRTPARRPGTGPPRRAADCARPHRGRRTGSTPPARCRRRTTAGPRRCRGRRRVVECGQAPGWPPEIGRLRPGHRNRALRQCGCARDLPESPPAARGSPTEHRTPRASRSSSPQAGRRGVVGSGPTEHAGGHDCGDVRDRGGLTGRRQGGGDTAGGGLRRPRRADRRGDRAALRATAAVQGLPDRVRRTVLGVPAQRRVVGRARHRAGGRAPPPSAWTCRPRPWPCTPPTPSATTDC